MGVSWKSVFFKTKFRWNVRTRCDRHTLRIGVSMLILAHFEAWNTKACLMKSFCWMWMANREINGKNISASTSHAHNRILTTSLLQWRQSAIQQFPPIVLTYWPNIVFDAKIHSQLTCQCNIAGLLFDKAPTNCCCCCKKNTENRLKPPLAYWRQTSIVCICTRTKGIDLSPEETQWKNNRTKQKPIIRHASGTENHLN